MTTPEEVRGLEDLGVDYIGFDVNDDACFLIDPEPFWEDERYLSEQHIPELLPLVRRAQGYVHCAQERLSAETVSRLAGLGVRQIQIEGRHEVEPDVASACQQAGVGLIYGHLYIVPEDRPAFYDFIRPDRPCLTLFDLQVFPSDRDAWTYLVRFSPQHRDEVVTLEDLLALAEKAPLFLSLNTNLENIGEIVETLRTTAVAGLSFTLSPTEKGSFHTFEFEQVVTLLRAIRTLG